MGRFDLVIFDLDGTVTQPYLDFKKIRKLIQNAIPEPLEEPLLEKMLLLQGEPRRVAFEILESQENDAALNSELNPGAHEVLREIRKRSLPCALLSRNSRVSVQTVLAKHSIGFDFVATRDDGPVKPDPRSVLRILEHFRARPDRSLVIGDFKYDIMVGQAAGTKTCLLTNGSAPSFDVTSDYVIHGLSELIPLLG